MYEDVQFEYAIEDALTNLSLEDNKAVPYSPQSDVSTADSFTPSQNNASKIPNSTTIKQTQPSKSSKPKQSGIENQTRLTLPTKSSIPKTIPLQSVATKTQFETDDLVPLPDSEVEA